MQLSHLVARINSSQLIGVAARVVQIGAGFITIILVGTHLDVHIQGYFYTFGSLVALQVLAEIGLGTVLVQFVSHEMSGVRWNGRRLEGAIVSLQRIRNITEFAIKWFGIGSFVLVLLLLIIGQIFFGKLEQAPEGLWSAWIVLVFATGISLFTNAINNLLEGSGKVFEVSAVRLMQQLFGAIAAWGFILLGYGLAALAIQALVIAGIGIIFISTHYQTWKVLRINCNRVIALDWRSEILPFQWRIAVSWLSGYITFQAFIPVVFVFTGPEAAGKLGMSMQIFSALSSIAITLITARSPTFGRLVSSKKIIALDILFRVSLLQSVCLLVGSLVMLALGLLMLNVFDLPILSRLLPIVELGIFSVAVIGSHLVTAQATYLRAFKREPFMRLAVLNAALVMLISIWLIPHFGASGAIWTYAVVTLLVSLPLGTLIFRKFRAEQAVLRLI